VLCRHSKALWGGGVLAESWLADFALLLLMHSARAGICCCRNLLLQMHSSRNLLLQMHSALLLQMDSTVLLQRHLIDTCRGRWCGPKASIALRLLCRCFVSAGVLYLPGAANNRPHIAYFYHRRHQITRSSHSINVIGPAPPPPERKKEGAPLHYVCNYYAHPKLSQDTQQCS
jgi:hypothetical protein